MFSVVASFELLWDLEEARCSEDLTAVHSQWIWFWFCLLSFLLLFIEMYYQLILFLWQWDSFLQRCLLPCTLQQTCIHHDSDFTWQQNPPNQRWSIFNCLAQPCQIAEEDWQQASNWVQGSRRCALFMLPFQAHTSQNHNLLQYLLLWLHGISYFPFSSLFCLRRWYYWRHLVRKRNLYMLGLYLGSRRQKFFVCYDYFSQYSVKIDCDCILWIPSVNSVQTFLPSRALWILCAAAFPVHIWICYRSKQEYFSVFHGLEQIWQSFIVWISLEQLCRETNLRDWLVISCVLNNMLKKM